MGTTNSAAAVLHPPQLQCKDCGRAFEHPADESTPRCPHCGSIRYSQTQRRVGGSYVSASCPVDEDRFARTALWGDLITSEQFAECIEEQKARATAGREVPSLPHLLVERGYLRRDSADAVFRVMTTQSPERWRTQFGQVALSKGFITEDQLRECLELQTKLVMSTGSAPFLGHLLLENGYMTESQVFAILKAQEQHHLGVLHDLESALRPTSGKVSDFFRRRPRLVQGLILAVAIAAAGSLGAWLQGVATAPRTLDLLCDQCGNHTRAPASAIARPCRQCGRGELCTPLWCSKCRVAFPIHVRTSETEEPWIEGCPVCGTLSHVKLPIGLGGLAVKPPER